MCYCAFYAELDMTHTYSDAFCQRTAPYGLSHAPTRIDHELALASALSGFE